MADYVLAWGPGRLPDGKVAEVNAQLGGLDTRLEHAFSEYNAPHWTLVCSARNAADSAYTGGLVESVLRMLDLWPVDAFLRKRYDSTEGPRRSHTGGANGH